LGQQLAAVFVCFESAINMPLLKLIKNINFNMLNNMISRKTVIGDAMSLSERLWG
jgi:hypothetical protein